MLIPQWGEKHPGSFSYVVRPKETAEILLRCLRDQDDSPAIFPHLQRAELSHRFLGRGWTATAISPVRQPPDGQVRGHLEGWRELSTSPSCHSARKRGC